MPRAIKEGNCHDCGERVRGASSRDGFLRCLDCKLAMARESALQLASHSGPYYDRWLQTRGPRGRPRTGIVSGGTDEAR